MSGIYAYIIYIHIGAVAVSFQVDLPSAGTAYSIVDQEDVLVFVRHMICGYAVYRYPVSVVYGAVLVHVNPVCMEALAPRCVFVRYLDQFAIAADLLSVFILLFPIVRCGKVSGVCT